MYLYTLNEDSILIWTWMEFVVCFHFFTPSSIKNIFQIGFGCGMLVSAGTQTPHWVHASSPRLWLAVITTTPVPIGCGTKLGNRKLKKKKKILSTKVHVSFCLTFFRVLKANVAVNNCLIWSLLKNQNGVLLFEKIQKKVIRKRGSYADDHDCRNYDDKQRGSPWQQHRRGTETVQLG